MVGPKPFFAMGRISVAEPESASEDAAFDEVFRRYYAAVYGVLMRITGSPEEAEDLAQEVFLRFHEHQYHLDPDGNLGGWLYRVATHAGFNSLRSRRRRRDRLLRWARLERPLQETAPSAASVLEERQDADLVRHVLAGLRERDQTVLVLRYSGVSYAEIADAIGVKPSSVGTLLVRAEQALRTRYEELFPSR